MQQALRFRTFIAGFLTLLSAAAWGQTANFTATPLSGCAPKLVQFTSTSTGSISSYSWSFGNGASSVFQNPSTTYTAPGVYSVSLTVTGPGGSNTKTITNYITAYAPPAVSFTASNAIGCLPLSTSFASSVTPNAPGTATYSWNFGDGNTSTQANPTHTYTTAGTFNVTLTVTSGAGCSTTITQTAMVTAYPRPSAAFNSPVTTYCSIPASVPFICNGASGATVSWYFGDGSTGTGASLSHTYTAAGAYTITAIAMNSQGCMDTVTATNYITVLQSVNTATFSSPLNVCIEDTASFTNTTTGSSGPPSWYFGDGYTASGNSVKHAYGTGGPFLVRMVITSGQCPDTGSAYINVQPRPVAQIQMSPAIPCPAPVTVVFLGSGSTGGSSYQWSWKKGGAVMGANVAHTYSTAPLIDTAKLVVTSIYGCKDSITFVDTIRNAIITKAGIMPREGCAPLTVHFRTELRTSLPPGAIYPAAITSYSWNFGDGASSSQDSPVHTYMIPGIYIATITLTTANGCTIQDTAQIRLGAKVKPSFSIANQNVCFGTLIYATNTTSTTYSPLTYYYTTSQNHLANATAPVTGIPADSGRLTITLHSNYNGCEDTTSLADSVVVNPPRAAMIDSLPCKPYTTVKFVNQSWGATLVYWDFGDGTTSTVFSPTHTYPSRSNYLVKLVVYNSTSGCKDSLYRQVPMSTPVLSLTALDTSICRGDTLHLTGSGNPLPFVTRWNIDNIYQPFQAGKNLDTLLPVGRHTITFVAEDFWGCVDSIRRPNYVIVSHPDVAFGASPLLGCTPLPVLFRDSTSFIPGTAFGSRFWDFGDGGTSTSIVNPLAHTYMVPGLYNVKLVVADFNGCADSLTKYYYVEARHITAAFTVNRTSACIGEQLAFTNASSGAAPLRFSWSFGDGGTSSLPAPSHAYAATGSYTVRLIATDTVSGCMDTLTRNAYISITKPVTSFTLSDTFSVCLPANVIALSTSTGASTLLWQYGSGSTSSLVNPLLTFTSPGVYTVRLIATNSAGCSDTSATRTIRVLGYNGALTYSAFSGCVPLTVHFRSLIANVPNLIWDFSDGTTVKGTKDTISHTYITPGAYVPRLIFSNNSGCTAASDGVDTIKVDVIHAGFKVTTPCVTETAHFVDTSHSLFWPPNSWHWDFGGGQAATGPVVSRTYPTPGRYPVKLIVTNTIGCIDSLAGDFTIYPLPVITASPDTVVCVPDAVPIRATGGMTYAWSLATGLSCTACPSPKASPAVPTSYIVTGTDSNGCSNRDTVKIGIQTKTSFNVTAGGEICFGQHFQLSAGGATLYHWMPAAGLDDADKASPVATPLATTTYVATGREGSCLADTHIVKVVVNPLPVIDAGKDEKTIAGSSVQLQVSGTGIDHLRWDTSAALSCLDCYAPYAAPTVTTTFYVAAYTSKGCLATDSVRVIVLCDQSQLFIPNTFTPNGDGLNDYFFPRGKGIRTLSSFRIYSRWGELLYERSPMAVNDEYAGWDGAYHGVKLAPDVYVYIIEAACDAGEPIMWKGDVTLLR